LRQNAFVPAPPEPARGLLQQAVSFTHFDLIRFAPAEDLRAWVENHWLILWHRQGEAPYMQRNLSHPNQHLVIDPQGQTGIFGAATGIFSYPALPFGRVLGTKFRTGSFHGFLGEPVRTLTDGHVSIRSVFARKDRDLETEFIDLNDPTTMAERVEAMLRERLPVLEPKALLARTLVERVAAEPALFSVRLLAGAAGMTVRSLQRLFDTYVGVTPKWVIDRYRMIEAVDALNRGEAVNLTQLAQQLGYFDQAHFTRAFQQLTGHPPSYYRLSA
jgi:AraC-like DNA-binding protein